MAKATMTRIYLVEVTHERKFEGHGGEDATTITRRLVKASSAYQAVRHVAKGIILATVPTQETLINLTKDKVEVEVAG